VSVFEEALVTVFVGTNASDFRRGTGADDDIEAKCPFCGV
jgi:hypothetical protein